ncbi:MAG: PorV/PorQ family protein [Ignavibacteriales bacterium]
MTSHLRYFLLMFFCLSISLHAQYALNLVNNPGTVRSFAMGEQGVALMNGGDAFTYNPAGFSFQNRTRISYFVEPYTAFVSIPTYNYTAMTSLPGIGTVALQYLRKSYGEIHYTTVESPDGDPSRSYSAYEYGLSAGIARNFSESFSAGAALRFAQSHIGYSFNMVMLSLGLNYHPAILDQRLNLGFSLMNLGGTTEAGPEIQIYGMKIDNSVETPAIMNLGIYGKAVDNDYLTLGLELGAKRRISGNETEAKSSFSSLFSGWKFFPEDAAVNTGVEFSWKPLDLGRGFSFLQNYYVGTHSPGPDAAFYVEHYSHGAEIGLGYNDFSLTAGYSGWWHKRQPDYYFFPDMPYETFQFTFEWNLGRNNASAVQAAPLKNIILSAGAAYNLRSGQLIPPGYTDKSRDGMSYNIEAAFYMDNANALVASFGFTSIPFAIGFKNLGGYYLESSFETLIAGSSYRYHPLEALAPLFVQGGISLARLNLTLPYAQPKYTYEAALNASIGALLKIPGSRLAVTPEIGYLLMGTELEYLNSAAKVKVGGENQFSLSLKAGYQL